MTSFSFIDFLFWFFFFAVHSSDTMKSSRSTFSANKPHSSVTMPNSISAYNIAANYHQQRIPDTNNYTNKLSSDPAYYGSTSERRPNKRFVSEVLYACTFVIVVENVSNSPSQQHRMSSSSTTSSQTSSGFESMKVCTNTVQTNKISVLFFWLSILSKQYLSINRTVVFRCRTQLCIKWEILIRRLAVPCTATVVVALGVWKNWTSSEQLTTDELTSLKCSSTVCRYETWRFIVAIMTFYLCRQETENVYLL